MPKTLNLYWCRRDLRLHDNPALHMALNTTLSAPKSLFLPLFVLEDYMCTASTKFQFGLPQRAFLAKSIPYFAKHFPNFFLARGKAAKTIINIQNILQTENIQLKVFVNEDIYIDFYKQISKLKQNGIPVEVCTDQLTIDKELLSGTGKPYSIFTPFKKACWKQFLTAPVLPKVNASKINPLEKKLLHKLQTKLTTIDPDEKKIFSEFSQNQKFEIYDYVKKERHTLDINKLLPNISVDLDLYYSEEMAINKYKSFLEKSLKNYGQNRDSLEIDAATHLDPGTSKMSLALAWGLVSARYLRHKIQKHYDEDFIDINWNNLPEHLLSPVQYLSELVWREFYKYLFVHHPNLMQEEFQEKFRFKIKWESGNDAIKRFTSWIKGETGYKIVDAAMMQLAKTGLMHNRTRMIVASVLTKNLGIDWRWGQEYFRAKLLDLDEASNNGGWQWAASVGADPKPIRIFNPYLQAENFDKNGTYQKKWLGEEKYFFEPTPIVEHKQARQNALKRYGLV